MTEKRKISIKKLNLVISLLLAFAAWVYVIYNYAPMKEVVYSDVPIDFVGEDTLAYKGLGVTNASADTVTIRAEIKRTDYANISADSFDVVADVSGAVTGGNGISLDVTAPAEVNVENVSISSVNVNVDRVHSKQVKVAAVYSDAIELNSEPGVSSMSYKQVTVSGTNKNLNKVKCAAVVFEMSSLKSRLQQFYMKPVALDENGKEVKHIVIVPSEIAVTAYAGITKEVPLKLNVTADSDELSYEVPETIVIKGKKDTLDEIEEIEAEDIDLSGISKDTEVPLTFALPDGVNVTRNYLLATLKVKVKE